MTDIYKENNYYYRDYANCICKNGNITEDYLGNSVLISEDANYTDIRILKEKDTNEYYLASTGEGGELWIRIEHCPFCGDKLNF